MVMAVSLPTQLFEYLENLRALLRLDAPRWRVVVERQVLSQLLPHLQGSRTNLETHLWELLVLCLDGHESTPPPLDDATWEQALAAVSAGIRLEGEGPAAFGRAARGVADVILSLREHGIHPPPKVSP